MFISGKMGLEYGNEKRVCKPFDVVLAFFVSVLIVLKFVGEYIVIGNDVWIGFEAVILSGVTIGDGAVIGTRAVVTKDVSPYTIVGGVPAKPIRKRFSDDVISELLKLRWWDWSENRIKKNLAAIQAGRMEALE